MDPALDDELGSAVVSYRPTAGEEASAMFTDMPLAGLVDAAPWRTFVWYKGQKHYSGSYWSTTERRHVIYESLHELSCLLLADFDPGVERIVAQPFRLTFPTRPRPTTHVPDFLLSTDRGAVVVDVTWPERLKEPETATRLALTQQLLDRRGWIYAVVTEYPAEFLANVRFLAGFRREWLINQEALAVLRSERESLVGMSVGDVALNIQPLPTALIRSALFHLLWRAEVVVDLTTRLSPSTGHRGGVMASAHTRMGVGTRFVYDGEVIEVVEMHAAGLGLGVVVKDHAGRLRRIAVRELLSSNHSRIVADGAGPASNDQEETAATTLAMLDRKKRQHLTDRADHVRELLTGFRSGTAEVALPGEPMPAYCPGVPMMKRYAAKAAELGKGKRTVQRWVRLYRANGQAGLVDKRDVRRDGHQRDDNRFDETMLEVMVESTNESKPSGMKIITQAGARATVRHGEGAVWIPARATAYRDLAKLEKKHPLLRLPTKRNRDIAGRPQTAYGKLRATRPGEYLYMDCNRLDVFAFDPLTRKPVTCKLTAALDGYSRCLTGLRLTPVGVKSFDVASVLFETLRPPPAKPWWPEDAVWPEMGMPRSVFIEHDAWEKSTNSASGPSLVPETVVIDHEKIFMSDHVDSVCQRLGISVQPARLDTARDKGPLERFFLTLRHDLLQFLPGYKGNDLTARGVAPEDDAVFFIDQLEELIRDWVAAVYHRTTHDGLCEPGLDTLELSPAAMFERGVACAGYIEVPRDPDLAFEFLQVVNRTIQPAGVVWKNRLYNDCEHNVLREHAGEHSPYGSACDDKWPIAVNPDDITKVYFRHANTLEWHTLPWEHAPLLRMPMSEDGLQWARKQARENYEYPDDRLAIADLLKRWGIPLEMTPTERRIILRLTQTQSWLAQALKTADQATPAIITEVDDVEEAGDTDVVDREYPPSNDDDFYAETWETLT